jgi:hypothetical protein
MKKPTYDELHAERDRLARSEGLLSVALNVLIRGKAEATEQVSHDGGRTKLQLFGASRADGGIVIETYYHPGQASHSAAYYLDDLARVPGHLSEGGLKYASAVERLTLARNRIATGAAHEEHPEGAQLRGARGRLPARDEGR